MSQAWRSFPGSPAGNGPPGSGDRHGRSRQEGELRPDARSVLRSFTGRVLGSGRAAGRGAARLRHLQRLPDVLQVLRQLPAPLRAPRPEGPRRPPPRRCRDRGGHGRLLPVQAVRGAVPVHPPRRPPLPARLPGAGPPARRAEVPRRRREARDARALPGRPRHGRQDGPPVARARQRHEQGGAGPLGHGEGAGRRPARRASRLRLPGLRLLGRAGRLGEARARRRGGALPDLLRPEQRHAAGQGHPRGAPQERRGRPRGEGAALLRHAGLGARRHPAAAPSGAR